MSADPRDSLAPARAVPGVAIVLVWLWGAALGWAQLPEPRVTAVFPPGAKAGTTGLELSVAGENLDEAVALVFSHAGIRGTPVMSAPTPLSGKSWALSDRHLVDVAADVPPGIYELRFQGRFGQSNAVAFAVGSLEEMPEGGGNQSAEMAMPLAAGMLVNGRADEGRADYFRIGTKAGESLRVRCVAGGIDSRMQPELVLFDAAGTGELARAGTAAVRDARLDYAVARDGDVVLRVADFLGKGGVEFAYRLYLESADEPPITVAEAGGWGNEELPTVVKEPGNPEPLRLMPPCVVEGTWNPSGARERFVIDAVKGQTYAVEIFSERLGHATDPVLTVERHEPSADGGPKVVPVGRFDDLAQGGGKGRLPLGSRDAAARFTADAEGDYHLAIADQFGGGAAPTRYRLRVAAPRPDFGLVAALANPVTENKQILPGFSVLRSGGALGIEVHALRRDGFDGPIALRCEGLPDGVVAENAEIPAGRLDTLLVMRAGTVSARWDGNIRIVGTGEPGERAARVMRLRSAVADFDREEVRYVGGTGFGLSLLPEESPLRVAVKEGTPTKFESSLGGTVQIPFTLARLGTFKGNVRIRPEGLAGMNQAPEVQLDEKTGEGVVSIAFANRDNNLYAPGTLAFRLFADGVIAYEPNAEAKATAEAEKQEAEKRAGELAAQAAAAPESKELAEALRKAEEEKARLTERAAQATERAKARDVKVFAYAPPLTVRLAASPVRIAAVVVPEAVVAGSEAVLKVTVGRDYGFTDTVRIEAVVPEATAKVLRVEPAAVAADQTEAEVRIAATPGAAEGTYPFQLKAKLTFNGMELETTHDLVVSLRAATTP